MDPANAYANRLVLIGNRSAADPGYRTSLGVPDTCPAMLMTATSMSNLLQGDYVVRPDLAAARSELAILLLIGVAILFVAPYPHDR